MVVKSFKGAGDKGAHSVDQYLKQIEVSTIAAHLGNLFNTTAAKPPGCPKVSFLKSHVISTNSIPARTYCLEHLLEGTFTKLCNNTGYWNDAALDEQTALVHFVEWTHKVTKGYLLVADLQGVYDYHTKSYLLTDPVILCTDVLRFGNTNLGPKFMERVLNACATIRA